MIQIHFYTYLSVFTLLLAGILISLHDVLITNTHRYFDKRAIYYKQAKRIYLCIVALLIFAGTLYVKQPLLLTNKMFKEFSMVHGVITAFCNVLIVFTTLFIGALCGNKFLSIFIC
jgi:hypothetical protein